METFFKTTEHWITATELFVLLFVAFLIGFYFGKKSVLRRRKHQKRTVSKNVNEIETIFTEIKPEILKIIEQHKTTHPYSEQHTPEKEILSQLDFNSIGYADASEKDDLTKIKGVSPFVEEKLNHYGIYTYEQISRFTKEDMDTVTKLIEYFPGRMERDKWVQQAYKLMQKNAAY